MKVYDYIIVLKRRGYALVDGISQLMLFLAVVVFATSSTITTFSQTSAWLLGSIAVIMGWWLHCFLQRKKGNMPFYRIALTAAAVGWAIQPGWGFVAVIYILAAILEKQVKFPQEIAFDADEIVVNSFPRKHFQWNELQNVVMKDGILTVDFHNNTLIQKEIETQASAQTEQEFNEFCLERLKADSIALKA